MKNRFVTSGGEAYRNTKEKQRLQEQFRSEIPGIIKDSIDMYSIALLNVLHDKWGFGQERATRLLEQVNSLCDSLVSGDIDIIDIREAVIEDLKIYVGDSRDYTRGKK